MKLIKEYKQWYKLWSVWLFALVGLYQWAEANWDVLHAIIPKEYQGTAGLVLAVLGIVSRLVVQSNIKKD